MHPLTIGDLIVLELALQKFLEGIDLSLEAGKHCSAIIGKLEVMIQQQASAAMSLAPDFLRAAQASTPPVPGQTS